MSFAELIKNPRRKFNEWITAHVLKRHQHGGDYILAFAFSITLFLIVSTGAPAQLVKSPNLFAALDIILACAFFFFLVLFFGMVIALFIHLFEDFSESRIRQEYHQGRCPKCGIKSLYTRKDGTHRCSKCGWDSTWDADYCEQLKEVGY